MNADIQSSGDATRMLGAIDGLLSGIVAVQSEMNRLQVHRSTIPPRFRNRIAEIDRSLAPLRNIDNRLRKEHAATKAAYAAAIS